ncbi:MAG: DUF4091 domain-containing protein [Alistipes sp.]|nr:DUF4091 domain-containing protein [Alistipes sp.]
MKSVLAFMAAAIFAVGCSGDYQRVETFEELALEQTRSEEVYEAWGSLGRGLYGGWSDKDLRYVRDEVPEREISQNMKLTCWRGERASAQIMLWSAEGADGVECKVSDLKSADAKLPGSIVQTRFVRYTITDEQTFSYKKSGNTFSAADMLDSLARFDMAPCSTRPVWVTFNIPQDAKAGVYSGKITISHQGCGKLKLPFELEVVDHTLAPVAEWSYHLDLWQHPSAVARAQGLEMWSDEHFEAMRPVMQLLANAGQKVITATLNKDPWNHQCYDGYESMILWTLGKDGEWRYDYKVFDRWVEMMLGLGINKMINCYSMVPWNNELEYWDEAKGETITVKADPGTKIFKEIWTPFLKDFTSHLREKGWLSITNIAMDERSPKAMDAAAELLEQAAPELNFALADNHKSYKRYTMMRDVCVAIHHPADHADIVMRREKGHNTTFYICCVPSYPNTFTNSEPFESELLGWYGVATDYDGMLRWAYNSWPENPHLDSRYGNWMGGDTFLVYPYARSSVRFEMLIEGIEVAEKVRALRREGVDTSAIEAVLERICTTNSQDHTQPWHEIVVEARKALDEVSRM